MRFISVSRTLKCSYKYRHWSSKNSYEHVDWFTDILDLNQFIRIRVYVSIEVVSFLDVI